MKYLIYLLCFLSFVVFPCIVFTRDTEKLNYMSDLYSSGNCYQYTRVIWITPVFNFLDTLSVIESAAYSMQNYDSVSLYKLQVNLNPIKGDRYSVTNDSAVFIATFWGKTNYNYLDHPLFLKLPDRIVQVNIERF